MQSLRADALQFDLCDLNIEIFHKEIPYGMSINQMSMKYEWLNPNNKTNWGENI